MLFRSRHQPVGPIDVAPDHENVVVGLTLLGEGPSGSLMLVEECESLDQGEIPHPGGNQVPFAPACRPASIPPPWRRVGSQ